MTHRPLCEFLVASCVPDGGVYRYRLFENGQVEQSNKISIPEPMFFEKQGDRLWVVLRAPFENSRESGVAAYDTESGERLTDVISTLGEVACHIAVDGEDLYCANYISGSVFKAPDMIRAHSGHGTNMSRQEKPHVHSVFLSHDRQYVLVCDLGIDTVFVYDRDLNEVSRARVPDGSGARHLAFSGDGRFVYCINEMSATVSVFSYAEGKLTYLHDVDVKPQGFEGQGKGAAIKLSADGTRLYVTERGSQTIALYHVDNDRLTYVSHVSSHGEEPRDFALLANEKWAVCTNQFGNSIAIYKVENDGTLTYARSVALPAPLCVAEL